MPKFYKLDLWDVGGAIYPPMVPLLGRRLAKRSRVRSVMRAQNRVPALGRRVVLTHSLNGWGSFLVPNTTPIDTDPAGSRTHPPPELERPVFFGKFDLTPGCFLRMSVLHMPNGKTQDYFTFQATTQFLDGGGVGRLKVTIVWTDRDGESVTTNHEVTLTASMAEHGAIPTDGDVWQHPRLKRVNLMIPADLDDPVDLNRWTRGTHVEISGYQIGGPRILDCVISERPYALAMEAMDDAGLWASPCWGSTPNAAGPPYEYPVERLVKTGLDTDPRGHVKIAECHHAQWDRLGPSFFTWQAWDENNGDLGSDTDDTTITRSAATCTSATYVRLIDGDSTGYDTTEPGWSMMTGAYGRRLNYNHPSAMDGNNGTVPVWIDVLTKWGSGTPPTAGGHVKIQSAAYSFVEVPIPDTHAQTWTWVSRFGHLRCGTGPGDPVIAQAFFKRDATGSIDMEVGAIQVTRAGQWKRPGMPARIFDGSTDRLDWAATPFAVDGEALTVACWIKIDSTASSWSRMLNIDKSSPATDNTAFQLNGAKLYFFQRRTSTAITRRSSTSLSTGTWYHVAATYTGSDTATEIEIYIDGVVSAGYDITTNGVGSTYDGAGPWALGGMASADTRNFPGIIADVRAWNRVLTAAEVLAEKNSIGRVVDDSDLVFRPNLRTLLDPVSGIQGTEDGTDYLTVSVT